MQLLRELLEAEVVVLLLLVRLEHLDLGLADVHVWQLWLVVGGDLVVLRECLINLAP